MKKTILFTSLFLLLVGFTVAAQDASETYAVTADDLAEAGMEDISVVGPGDERFLLPVHYFRVAPPEEQLDGRDCDDCGDLVAVHVAGSDHPPLWSVDQTEYVRIIGKRFQVRRYEATKKLVIIVTGPDQNSMLALSDLLARKF